jgi:hypothetical protein
MRAVVLKSFLGLGQAIFVAPSYPLKHCCKALGDGAGVFVESKGNAPEATLVVN